MPLARQPEAKANNTPAMVGVGKYTVYRAKPRSTVTPGMCMPALAEKYTAIHTNTIRNAAREKLPAVSAKGDWEPLPTTEYTPQQAPAKAILAAASTEAGVCRCGHNNNTKPAAGAKITASADKPILC